MLETTILTPVFVLIVWTLIIFLWMYGTRMPAMGKANVDPQSVKHPSALPGILPSKVEAVADNYNHLMEQPTIFYALCFYLAIAGHADATHVKLAWAFVGLRIAHSLVQNTSNNVMVRFSIFTLSTVMLIVMAIREVLVLI